MPSETTETTTDAPSPAPVQVHQVSFSLNLRTGLWRASCCCGWSWVSDNLEELDIKAAGHDLAEVGL